MKCNQGRYRLIFTHFSHLYHQAWDINMFTNSVKVNLASNCTFKILSLRVCSSDVNSRWLKNTECRPLYIYKGLVMVLGRDDWLPHEGFFVGIKSSGRISTSWRSHGCLVVLLAIGTAARWPLSGKTTVWFCLCTRWQLGKRKGCECSV